MEKAIYFEYSKIFCNCEINCHIEEVNVDRKNGSIVMTNNVQRQMKQQFLFKNTQENRDIIEDIKIYIATASRLKEELVYGLEKLHKGILEDRKQLVKFK